MKILIAFSTLILLCHPSKAEQTVDDTQRIEITKGQAVKIQKLMKRCSDIKRNKECQKALSDILTNRQKEKARIKESKDEAGEAS